MLVQQSGRKADADSPDRPPSGGPDRRPRAGPILAFLAALMLADVSLTALALALAYQLRFRAALLPYLEFHAWSEYAVLLAVECVVFPTVFLARGLYHFHRNISRLDELQRVFTGLAIGTVVVWAASAFVARDFSYSRAMMALNFAMAVLLIWLGRIALHFAFSLLLRRGAAEERVLIVGTGEMASAITEKIRQAPGWGYRVVGLVAPDGVPAAEGLAGLPLLGSAVDVEHVIRDYAITEVIIAEPALSHQDIVAIVDRCDRQRVSIKVFPDVFQIISSGVTISDLNGLPLLSMRDASLRGINRTIKRAVDVAISGIVLVVLSPVMLGIALLIKLTDPEGPVFYAQERVGLDGKIFTVLKFRSMRVDAESETGPVWARRGDPRATPLGRFLRRFSLDELPQFINVLLGDMSIVGPRPERPHFVEQFRHRIPRYWERHREKAGLTGWAQVNGLRGNTSIEERTAYDLWYVENWSLWLDFKIMLRTVVAIFRDSHG
ncbi:MAG: undecaprenyl-phosphate glucose phosphotransferase [Chloroflexi bacterium]|nr:undecaprenyl-phosphate glucose phosphotransferase [Chloroflexota bacterium]